LRQEIIKLEPAIRFYKFLSLIYNTVFLQIHELISTIILLLPPFFIHEKIISLFWPPDLRAFIRYGPGQMGTKKG
jgi:hypothetical protein